MTIHDDIDDILEFANGDVPRAHKVARKPAELTPEGTALLQDMAKRIGAGQRPKSFADIDVSAVYEKFNARPKDDE
jgi:hypothetical protein